MAVKSAKKPLSFDEFVDVLVEVLVTEPGKVVPEAHFITDLGVDSIRLVELMMRFQELGIEISPESVWEIQTVGDAYQHYSKQMSGRG